MPGAIPSPSSGSSPAQPPKPHDGGGKPKMSEKVGDDEFNKESSLTGSSEPGGDGGDKSESVGKKTADKAKDLAASASETAKDVKDVAKAGPTGLETSAQEIEQGRKKAGTKGAAAAAGREAAGQAVATGVDVLTAGATTESHGKIAKATSKLLKKENLKKVALAAGIVVAMPLILFGIIIGVVLYAASDPWKFASQVLTDPKVREFTAQAAALAGKEFLASQDDILQQYGYVENNSGAAVAQTSAPAPKPGSLAEKLTKINMKNAVYQTNAKPSCPYTFTYKDMTGPNGQQTSVIDKVYNNRGQEVQSDNFVVNYCIAQSMPLYNLMVRVDKGQEVNKFSNTVLNYAAQPDSLKGKSYEEINEYVYDKTLNRITSSADQDPKIESETVTEYIANVRKALEDGEDPYSVDSDFDFPPEFNEDQKTVNTMCTFVKGYLLPNNIRNGIFSRINTGQRSGVKSNTLSSTRHLGLMSNDEVGPTFKQMENWAASRAYHQNVYGTQAGEAINPESLGNTSYGAGYKQAIGLLLDIRDECEAATDSSFFSNFFGSGQEQALANIKIDYEALRDLIVAESNGKFTSKNDFGMQQLMIGVIRMGGGSAVSGLEPGPWNFNNQSQGYRGLSNQYVMRVGGRFLTAEETNKLSNLAENTRREIEDKNGLAYRLFGKDNIRSLANIIQQESPKTPNEINRTSRDYIAKISNPLKLIADIHSSVGYIATGKINRAFAADATGDAYMRLDTIGILPNEFDGVDVLQNSDEIQEMIVNGTPEQKTLLGYFDKCSKSNYPSKNFFIKYPAVSPEGVVNLGSIYFVGTDKNKAPFYPVMADQIEYSNEDGSPNNEEANKNPIKEEKKAFMACEIMLQANPIILDDGGYSGATIPLDIRQNIFGNIDVEALAKKYRLYLYSNSMADLMVELSNTEESKNIYANPSGEGGATTNTSGEISPDVDTSSLSCPSGTTDKGVIQDYGPGPSRPPTVKIRACTIDGFNITVNASIANQVKELLEAAKEDGVVFGGGGLRSYEDQVRLRTVNGCPDVYTAPASSCRVPTAIPGNSMHEVGLAIDFSQNGSTIGSNSTGFAWLKQNAERFGLKNLPSEPWHWSVNGS